MAANGKYEARKSGGASGKMNYIYLGVWLNFGILAFIKRWWRVEDASRSYTTRERGDIEM